MNPRRNRVGRFVGFVSILIVGAVAALSGCRNAPADPPTTTAAVGGLVGSPGGSPGLLSAAAAPETSTSTTTTVRRGRKRDQPTSTTEPEPPPLRRRGLLTPQAASKNLWDAWRDDDRPRALLYANARSVSNLFKRPWDPTVRDLGCNVDPALTECTYVFDTTAAVVQIIGEKETGYRVHRVDLTAPPTSTNASGSAGAPPDSSLASTDAQRSETSRPAAPAKRRTTTTTEAKPVPITSTVPASRGATSPNATPAPVPAPDPVTGDRVPARVPAARSVDSAPSQGGVDG